MPIQTRNISAIIILCSITFTSFSYSDEVKRTYSEDVFSRIAGKVSIPTEYYSPAYEGLEGKNVALYIIPSEYSSGAILSKSQIPTQDPGDFILFRGVFPSDKSRQHLHAIESIAKETFAHGNSSIIATPNVEKPIIVSELISNSISKKVDYTVLIRYKVYRLPNLHIALYGRDTLLDGISISSFGKTLPVNEQGYAEKNINFTIKMVPLYSGQVFEVLEYSIDCFDNLGKKVFQSIGHYPAFLLQEIELQKDFQIKLTDATVANYELLFDNFRSALSNAIKSRYQKQKGALTWNPEKPWFRFNWNMAFRYSQVILSGGKYVENSDEYEFKTKSLNAFGVCLASFRKDMVSVDVMDIIGGTTMLTYKGNYYQTNNQFIEGEVSYANIELIKLGLYYPFSEYVNPFVKIGFAQQIVGTYHFELTPVSIPIEIGCALEGRLIPPIQISATYGILSKDMRINASLGFSILRVKPYQSGVDPNILFMNRKYHIWRYDIIGKN